MKRSILIALAAAVGLACAMAAVDDLATRLSSSNVQRTEPYVKVADGFNVFLETNSENASGPFHCIWVNANDGPAWVCQPRSTP